MNVSDAFYLVLSKKRHLIVSSGLYLKESDLTILLEKTYTKSSPTLCRDFPSLRLIFDILKVFALQEYYTKSTLQRDDSPYQKLFDCL